MSSWIKALENDPTEIRAAAVDAQRISDWLITCERSVADEQTAHQRPDGAAGQTPERRDPERPPHPVPEVDDASQAEHEAAPRDLGGSAQEINRAAVTGTGSGTTRRADEAAAT